MEGNNMVTPTRNLHRGKAPSKKGEPEICPRLTLLMHASLMRRSFP